MTLRTLMALLAAASAAGSTAAAAAATAAAAVAIIAAVAAAVAAVKIVALIWYGRCSLGGVRKGVHSLEKRRRAQLGGGRGRRLGQPWRRHEVVATKRIVCCGRHREGSGQ